LYSKVYYYSASSLSRSIFQKQRQPHRDYSSTAVLLPGYGLRYVSGHRNTYLVGHSVFPGLDPGVSITLFALSFINSFTHFPNSLLPPPLVPVHQKCLRRFLGYTPPPPNAIHNPWCDIRWHRKPEDRILHAPGHHGSVHDVCGRRPAHYTPSRLRCGNVDRVSGVIWPRRWVLFPDAYARCADSPAKDRCTHGPGAGLVLSITRRFYLHISC
jgi:hypothetical protein